MRACGKATLRSKGAEIQCPPTPAAAADILPLPWPAPGVSIREARRPHAHRCIGCSSDYRCAGPDQSGECPPVCGPCMWVELGAQLRMYRAMADTIDRRRRKIESQVGAAACRKAQTNRRDLLRNRNVLAGLGQMVLTRSDCAQDGRPEPDFTRINPSGEGY